MTKEELKKRFDTLETSLRIIAEDCGICSNAARSIGRIIRVLDRTQTEFEQYIDVLESLRQHPCFYAIKNFMEQIEDEFLTVEHSVEWTIIAGIISRSVALLEKGKKPTDVQSTWNALVSEVEQLKPMLATHLREIKPVDMVCEHHPGRSTGQFLGLGKRVLRISIPRRAQYYLTRKLLEREENIQILKVCLVKVVGEAVDIKIVGPTCPYCGEELKRDKMGRGKK